LQVTAARTEMLGSTRFHRLSREGFWIIFGQAIAMLGLLVGVRVLTELLEPTAYGELALGMTLATLMSQILIGPLGNGASRFYAPAVERDDLAGYLITIRRLLLQVVGVVAVMAIIAGIGLPLMGHPYWAALAVAALVFAVFNGCSSLVSGIQNAARQRSIVALHQGIDAWLRWLLAAGLMIWLGGHAVVAMGGYAVAAAVVLGSQYWFLRKSFPKRQDAARRATDWQAEIWSYSWPFASWGVFTWAQLVSDRWALELFATTEEVGFYAALYQLGFYPIAAATGMIVQFLTPIFFQRAGDASDRTRNADVAALSRRLSMVAGVVTAGLFLAAFLFHGALFRAFVAGDYRSVSHLLPWVVLAGGMFATGQTIGLDLMSRMKTQAMIMAKIVTALLGTALSFAGAYCYGIAGVVGASVLFSLTYVLWMGALSARHNRFPSG
jgi:O-antigen/teichoic acid export membrane protein